MKKQSTNNKAFTFEEMTTFLDLNDPEIDKMCKENPELYGRYFAQLINGAEGTET